jgi:hypothetical protein
VALKNLSIIRDYRIAKYSSLALSELGLMDTLDLSAEVRFGVLSNWAAECSLNDVSLFAYRTLARFTDCMCSTSLEHYFSSVELMLGTHQPTNQPTNQPMAFSIYSCSCHSQQVAVRHLFESSAERM